MSDLPLNVSKCQRVASMDEHRENGMKHFMDESQAKAVDVAVSNAAHNA